MSRNPLLLVLCAPLVALGCPSTEDEGADGATADAQSTASDDDDDNAGSTTDDNPGGTGEAPTTTDTPTTAGATEDETGSAESTGDDDPTDPGPITQGFLGDMGTDIGVECSVWDQDCPMDEKCMPWANDGGNTWNATRCVPLNATPGQAGDTCTVEGSGLSGVDSCAASAMCWNVDGETNEGTCIGFCAGSDASPICEDPSTTCSITNDGVLILCLPSCDPLLQDCVDGEGCYGIVEGYVCAPDASGEMGAYGDPCEAINVCDPGNECMAAAAVPDCTGSLGCCSPFCDTTAGGNSCPGADAGQECVAAFANGDAPPGYEDLGVCSIPA